MRYRIFTNDVGVDAYSALFTISARDQREANRAARRIANKLDCKAIALPENQPELWPDGITGILPAESERFIVQVIETL